MVDRLNFRIEYRPGYRSKRKIALRLNDYKAGDTDKFRILAMTEDQFNDMMSCRDTEAVQIKKPMSNPGIEDCVDDPSCMIIAKGTYTVGGKRLSGGRISASNPMALSIEDPAGYSDAFLKLDIVGGNPKDITPVTCNAGDLRKFRV